MAPFDDNCPLCRAPESEYFYEDRRRPYRHCPICRLVFVPPAYFLSAAAEKAEYDLHQNSPADPGYRRFLQRLFQPIQARLASRQHGLDFGSGPGPTLSVMFEEAGHPMAIYDPFYAREAAVFDRQYDFITASEVLEHLHRPRAELDRLWGCLKPGGLLGLMTKLVIDRAAFARWHYKNDPTHVCFFSQATFRWLARRWQARLTFIGSDVIILEKRDDTYFIPGDNVVTQDLLIKNVRPFGGQPVDLLIQAGLIRQLGPDLAPADEATKILDGQNQLLLPGLVNAHAHVDKNLLGLPWQKNQVPGRRIRDYVDNERRIRRELKLSAQIQSAHEVRAAIAAGTTHIRSHVDIDTEAGLTHFEGVMATREAFSDRLSMQLVAFPQSGMLIRPGTVELLEEALKLGADCIGGLDPSTVDRDPVRHLDTIFELAERYGVEVDIHLHEPGMLGAFAVELIAERTRALSLQGRVTISHVFCLGMVDEPYLERLIELLLESRIAIMSLGSGRSSFPPLQRLSEAGIALCTGTDGVRDTWGPYNSVDILERVKLLGYRSGYRKDEEIELLLQIATAGGARIMGDTNYGLAVGRQADLVVVPGGTPAEAVVTRPPRTYVIKRGRLVAAGGTYLPAE